MMEAYPGGRPAPANSAPESFENFDGENLDVMRYLNGLRRRWALVLLCCLLAAGLAAVRYSLTPKEYQAQTTIQIERKRLSLMALGQASWLEDWWNQEYYPTQYRLLRSRGMAERVVLNLRLHEDPSFTGRPVEAASDDEIQTSLNDAAALARLGSRLRGGLTVQPIDETQLVVLTYRSTSPELAARIANGYADAFIQWGIETRISTVGKASNYLTAQISSLRQEIDERQAQLNNFTVDHDIALDPAGEALFQRRSTLESQNNQVVTERITKEAAYRQLLNQPDEVIANSYSDGAVTKLEEEVAVLESEYQTGLKTFKADWPDMVSLQADIDEKKEQIRRLTRETVLRVRAQAYAEYQKAVEEENTITEELRKLADEARGYNSSALEYKNLTTLIETRKDLLTDLLKRQSQTEVASRVQPSQESNVRIVDTAIMPGAPFRPILSRELSQALTLGLLIGVGLALLLEYMDRTVKTPEELEKLLGLPNLAIIPDIEETQKRGYLSRYRYTRNYGYSYGGQTYGYSNDRPSKKKKGQEKSETKIELLPHHNPRMAICEAYRSLRTAILLSSAEALQVIAVTSAEPGEGKTATAGNLGVVMAQLGRRVLIIDADLRRPRMHKVFEVSNRHGLVNYLTGQVELEKVIQGTVVPDLFMLSSGPIPPNPSELLSAKPMTDVLRYASQHFDLVIVDTPPVLPVADAVILGPQVDGVVLCARAGVLLRDDAIHCRERLQYEGIRMLGAVLNRFRSQPGRYTRRHKYYGIYEESRPAEEKQRARSNTAA